MTLAERWVVTRLHLLVDPVTASCERYGFREVGRAIYDFFWNDFADWYIAASRTGRYENEDQTRTLWAQRTLHPYMSMSQKSFIKLVNRGAEVPLKLLLSPFICWSSFSQDEVFCCLALRPSSSTIRIHSHVGITSCVGRERLFNWTSGSEGISIVGDVSNLYENYIETVHLRCRGCP